MVLHDGIGELTRARAKSVAIGVSMKFAWLAWSCSCILEAAQKPARRRLVVEGRGIATRRRWQVWLIP